MAEKPETSLTNEKQEHFFFPLPYPLFQATCSRGKLVTSLEYMLSINGDSNSSWQNRKERRGGEMTAWSKGKGLRPPRQDCWVYTQPIMATSDPLGLGTNPSQHKRQINKKYILTLSSQGAGWLGEKEEWDLVL